MHSWTKTTLITLGCAGWLAFTGCHHGAVDPGANRSAQTEPVPGTGVPGQQEAEPSDAVQRAREQEFKERERALLAEVRAETPEESVRNLLYKTMFIISPFRSMPPGPEDLVADANRNPRVQKLLRIIREGADAQRQAIRDAILKMIHVYLTELPESSPEGVAWQPSVEHPGGGVVYFYLLSHLDVDPAGTLKLLVDVHLHGQAAYKHDRERRRPPGGKEKPQDIVMTEHGEFLAMTAEQLLTTLCARPDLQEGMTQPQLDVLHRFERRADTDSSVRHDPWQILQDATEFVYPLGAPGSATPVTTPASQPSRSFDIPAHHDSPPDLKQLVAMPPNGALSPEFVRGGVKSEMIPQLLAMLKDPVFADNWGGIAQLLALANPDPRAMPAIIDFITRQDDWRDLPRRTLDIRVGTKIDAARWIGWIGGPEATAFLRKVVESRAGAESALLWFHNERSSEIHGGSQDTTRVIFANAAAVGLVYTRDPENIAIVGDRFERCGAFRQAMVVNRIIDERGLDWYKRNYAGSEHDTLVSKYLRETYIDKPQPRLGRYSTKAKEDAETGHNAIR